MPSKVNAAVRINAPARFIPIVFFIPIPLILFLPFLFRLSEHMLSPFLIPDDPPKQKNVLFFLT